MAEEVQRIIEVRNSIGLSLNVNKCELIPDQATSIADPLLQSFERIAVKDATFLGAALFHGPTLDCAWAERCDDLSRAVDRLSVTLSPIIGFNVPIDTL